MDIKNQIVDLLVPDEEAEEKDFSPYRLSSGEVKLDFDEILDLANCALEAVKSDDCENIPFLVSSLAATPSFNYNYRSKQMLFMSIDHSRNPNPDYKERLMKDLEHSINEMVTRRRSVQLSSKFATFDVIVDYLAPFFGDDFEEEVIALAGVSRPTAKRYVRGNSPRGDYYEMFRSLAKIFYILETEHGKSEEEIIDFYRNEKIPGMTSSLRTVLTNHHYMPYSMKDKLQELNIVIY